MQRSFSHFVCVNNYHWNLFEANESDKLQCGARISRQNMNTQVSKHPSSIRLTSDTAKLLQEEQPNVGPKETDTEAIPLQARTERSLHLHQLLRSLYWSCHISSGPSNRCCLKSSSFLADSESHCFSWRSPPFVQTFAAEAGVCSQSCRVCSGVSPWYDLRGWLGVKKNYLSIYILVSMYIPVTRAVRVYVCGSSMWWRWGKTYWQTECVWCCQRTRRKLNQKTAKHQLPQRRESTETDFVIPAILCPCICVDIYNVRGCLSRIPCPGVSRQTIGKTKGPT